MSGLCHSGWEGLLAFQCPAACLSGPGALPAPWHSPDTPLHDCVVALRGCKKRWQEGTLARASPSGVSDLVISMSVEGPWLVGAVP